PAGFIPPLKNSRIKHKARDLQPTKCSKNRRPSPPRWIARARVACNLLRKARRLRTTSNVLPAHGRSMTLTTLSTGFLPVPAAAADGPGAVQGQDLDALLGQTDAGNPDDSAQPADFGILLQALLLAQTAQPLFTVPSPAVVSGQTVSSMTVSTSVSVEQLVLSDLGNDCAKPTSDSTPPECKGDGTVDAQPLPLARKNPWISATADLAAEEVDISDP